ncbi:glycosyltransferase [Taklimakanibacter deserti]|uniref:glycosyltransferase n=1 Tax=Taklimakanibacter deserti TaxID=2267839 RepID=UPI000E65C0B1
MDRAKEKAASRQTAWTAGVLLFSIITVATIQYWWHLPLRKLGSPADILGLILGLTLAFACLLISFRATPSSRASRMLTGMASLFLVLTIIEYFADPGPIDIPLSFLWLMPVLLLALSRLVSGHSDAARLSFLVCFGLQLAEVARSILATVYYGAGAQPVYFEWIESASDLLGRAFLLLGFVEALRLGHVPDHVSSFASLFTPPRPEGGKRHVAIFMDGLSGGDVQRRSVVLASGLLSRGYEVDFVVVNGVSKVNDQLSPGLRFIVLNAPHWGRLQAFLYRHLPLRWMRACLGAVAFTRYLLSENPGAVIAGSSQVLLSAVIAWQLAGHGMPLLLRATKLPSGDPKLWTPLNAIVERCRRGLSRLIYPSATMTVAATDVVAEEVARLAGLPRERIVTVFEPGLDDTAIEMSRVPPSHWLDCYVELLEACHAMHAGGQAQG